MSFKIHFEENDIYADAPFEFVKCSIMLKNFYENAEPLSTDIIAVPVNSNKDYHFNHTALEYVIRWCELKR